MFFFSNFTKNGILLPGIILNELYFSFYHFFCELKLFRIKILNNIYDTGVINLSRFEEKWKTCIAFLFCRAYYFSSKWRRPCRGHVSISLQALPSTTVPPALRLLSIYLCRFSFSSTHLNHWRRVE